MSKRSLGVGEMSCAMIYIPNRGIIFTIDCRKPKHRFCHKNDSILITAPGFFL